MNAPTGRLFVGAHMRFAVDGARVGEGQTERHGYAHVDLQPTRAMVGEHDLHITFTPPDADPFEVDAPVDVRPADDGRFEWPEATSRLEEGEDGPSVSDDEWSGALRVDVIPPDGELVRGLPNVVYLLLTDAKTHAPVEGTIAFAKIEGVLDSKLPAEVRTDALGLARLTVTPVGAQTWTVQATADGDDPATGEGPVRLTTVPAQFSLRMQSRLAIPGENVEGIVESLHRSGGMLVDLYDPDDWIGATAYGLSAGPSGLRLHIPRTPATKLYRVQVYQDLYDPQNAWDVAYLVRSDGAGTAACTKALDWVVARHAEQPGSFGQYASTLDRDRLGPAHLPGSRCGKWLDAMLLAIPRHFDPPPMMVNSQKADREALEAWRADVQDELIGVTALVLFIGFAVVLLFVLRGVQRSRDHARMLREVDLELADDDAEEPEPPGRFDVEKILVATRATIIVLSLLTFCLALLMILSWL